MMSAGERKESVDIMKIEIKEITAETQDALRLPNEPFLNEGKVIPIYDGENWSYRIEKFPLEEITEQCFPDEDYEFEKMGEDFHGLAAYIDGRCVGYAIIYEQWNEYLYLDNLLVLKSYRRYGVGSRLLDAAMELANEQKKLGVWLICQDNNLGACRFYFKNGYTLGGMNLPVYEGTKQAGKADLYLYKKLEKTNREAALECKENQNNEETQECEENHNREADQNYVNNKIYFAPGSHVTGDVTCGENVGIWYNAVVRGDTGSIFIDNNSNVQDNCTLHTDEGHAIHIGKGVSIGHNAVVHGCTIGENTVVGMGSIVLSGAKVGKNCIIGAGALVTGKMVIPDNSMAFGNPAKVVRQLTEEEIEANRKNAAHYVELMRASGK